MQCRGSTVKFLHAFSSVIFPLRVLRHSFDSVSESETVSYLRRGTLLEKHRRWTGTYTGDRSISRLRRFRRRRNCNVNGEWEVTRRSDGNGTRGDCQPLLRITKANACRMSQPPRTNIPECGPEYAISVRLRLTLCQHYKVESDLTCQVWYGRVGLLPSTLLSGFSNPSNLTWCVVEGEGVDFRWRDLNGFLNENEEAVDLDFIGAGL
jgi:hypothetical protein